VEDWEKHKGTKIDVLVTTLLWKLSSADHKEPPQNLDKSVDLDSMKADIRPSTEWLHEKSLVYHAFASQTALFKSAFEIHGVKTWALNGEMSGKERADCLKEFKNHQGPAVLLITQVGCAGLNIAFARWVFLADQFWSKQQKTQTVGRVLRNGQEGEVIVYEFTCLDTSDQLMGAGADVKGDLLSQF
ncbi:P-loop containing nucleoside triphosphate hydrolase protein, partial [Desarmillaria tabescens]